MTLASVNSSLESQALSLHDRVLGMWLGKSIGGTLGLPMEGYVGRGHLSYYDPIPESAPPNDDLELQLVWLHLLEKHGPRLDARSLGQGWLDHIHYMWDEYGRCRWNLRRGVPPHLCGTYENHFASGMGSPIRSEIWAVVHAGEPEAAAAWASLDASLDHGPEGIAGEVFLASLQSRLLGGQSLFPALHQSVRELDPKLETAAALEFISYAFSQQSEDPWETHSAYIKAFGNENFTHTPLNLGLILWALLYGKGDFEDTILLAVNGGYDTDCTAATVGAILGIISGAEAIPEKWSAPIGNGIFIGSGILGIDAPDTLEELTERSLSLSTNLRGTFPRDHSVSTPAMFDPTAISLWDKENHPLARWSNGELPEIVRQAGAFHFNWTISPEMNESIFRLIGLSPRGVTLRLDGKEILKTPADLPFVPATHRAPPESMVWVQLPAGSHRVEVVLGPGDAHQPASLMLTNEAMHFEAWNGFPLPHPARLPSQRNSHDPLIQLS
jgi:ADP-ribosylglycohydrolase